METYHNHLANTADDRQRLNRLLEDAFEQLAITRQLLQLLSHSNANKSFSKPATSPTPQQIKQVPDIAATDALYTPLQQLTELYGLELTRSDGQFHPQQPITWAKFVDYQRQLVNVFLTTTAIAPSVCGDLDDRLRQTTDSLRYELETLEDEIRQLMIRLQYRGRQSTKFPNYWYRPS